MQCLICEKMKPLAAFTYNFLDPEICERCTQTMIFCSATKRKPKPSLSMKEIEELINMCPIIKSEKIKCLECDTLEIPENLFVNLCALCYMSRSEYED
jgi:hypothetical protein